MVTQPPNGQQYGPGITRIAVTGFKSLAEKTEVEIRPLTVLAGANSSGKSSLMQPLLLMKQTLESDVNPAGPFRLSGPGAYTHYTESKQFLSSTKLVGDSCQRLVIDFEIGGQMTAGFTFAVDPNGSFAIDETRGSRLGVNTPMSWAVRHDSSAAEIRALNFPWDLLGSTKEVFDYHAERYRFYLCIKASKSSDAPDSWSQSYEFLETTLLNKETRRLIHVPGLRGDQLRKWLLTDVPSSNVFVGPFESYVPSIVEYWQQTNPRLSPSINELNAALRLLGLASSVRTLRLNESQIEMRVPRTFNSDESDYVNVADVGLAVSAVLPVLVALIQAEPGQLVYIDQPELHLHPKAQVLLAQLLGDAANRGAQLVIETHSSLLLRGILTQIAQNKISNDKVVLHWFRRDDGTGLSTVQSKEP
ncbi:MAG: AAA family ATPase, partial [Terracidiphilus sp.]